MSCGNEKTTVLIPSVDADKGQPLSKNYEVSITKISTESKLRTVSMTELYDTIYQSAAPVVDNLLYSGTYLFAGAPKVGKSFFMAQLAYHISMGLPLWENQVQQGNVLYLALEDDYARLQKRLARMFGTEENDHLHFATESKQLGNGLEEQLEAYIGMHPDLRLIIIDTLQKVRELGGDKFSYSSDYEIVTRLKQLSDRYRVCLLVVHHTRKQGADDCFDTISGTNGLLGAADGAFVLQKEKRTDNKAVLDVAGRDQQDQRIHLQFDREYCLWRFIKAETERWKEPVDPLLEAIALFVTAIRPEWIGTASELSVLLSGIDVSPNALTRRLNVSADRLLMEYGVSYESSRCHVGRQIKLTLNRNKA